MQAVFDLLKLRHRVRDRVLCIAALLVIDLAGATGCGNSLYALRANAATLKLEEARTAGARHLAPYEYTLAEEHLNKSMSEAAEADYGDAFELANAAYEYAEQAVLRCEQLEATTASPSGKEPGD